MNHPAAATSHDDAHRTDPTRNPDPLLTVRDAIAYTNVPERSLREHYRAGHLAYVKLGKRVLFRRSELDRWIEAGTRPARVTGHTRGQR